MKNYDELLHLRKEYLISKYSKNLDRLQKEIEETIIEQGTNIIVVYMQEVQQKLNELDVEYIMLEESKSRAKFIVFPTEKQKQIVNIKNILFSIFLLLIFPTIASLFIFGITNIIFFILISILAVYGFVIFTQVDFEKILKKYAIPLDKSNKKC